MSMRMPPERGAAFGDIKRLNSLFCVLYRGRRMATSAGFVAMSRSDSIAGSGTPSPRNGLAERGDVGESREQISKVKDSLDYPFHPLG
jgi:hypothetical protein